jgi:hypothetical protein
MARREWPPSPKKLSWTPISSTPSTWLQSFARPSSMGFEGAAKTSSSSMRVASGAGRALRSTLPLGVRGRSPRNTKAAGTI